MVTYKYHIYITRSRQRLEPRRRGEPVQGRLAERLRDSIPLFAGDRHGADDPQVSGRHQTGAPHQHFLPCHSFSHSNLKSLCAEQVSHAKGNYEIWAHAEVAINLESQSLRRESPPRVGTVRPFQRHFDRYLLLHDTIWHKIHTYLTCICVYICMYNVYCTVQV